MNIVPAHSDDSSVVPGQNITVSDISPTLGAEIVGLDLRDPTAIDANWSRINDLLRDRHILLFRDQSLDAETLGNFAQRFGTFERSVTQRADGTLSEPVHLITNLDAAGMPSKTPHRNSNYFWHSDKAFLANGSAMVMLFGLELPPKGGDTQFADMQAAYEGLSDADKALVDGLEVVHSFEHMRNTLMNRPLTDLERATVPGPRRHPLVRTDPVTGRKSLLLGMYACNIVGMTPEDGKALIARLQEHATQPRFVYTHQWRTGDFFAWNNLTLLHRALPNYDMGDYRRIMLRCGIKSDVAIR
jgi:alpha-ketoglutarate-dependent taurine dioxygenase